jgi:hypothetical protein
MPDPGRRARIVARDALPLRAGCHDARCALRKIVVSNGPLGLYRLHDKRTPAQ